MKSLKITLRKAPEEIKETKGGIGRICPGASERALEVEYIQYLEVVLFYNNDYFLSIAN